MNCCCVTPSLSLPCSWYYLLSSSTSRRILCSSWRSSWYLSCFSRSSLSFFSYIWIRSSSLYWSLLNLNFTVSGVRCLFWLRLLGLAPAGLYFSSRPTCGGEKPALWMLSFINNLGLRYSCCYAGSFFSYWSYCTAYAVCLCAKPICD